MIRTFALTPAAITLRMYLPLVFVCHWPFIDCVCCDRVAVLDSERGRGGDVPAVRADAVGDKCASEFGPRSSGTFLVVCLERIAKKCGVVRG